MVTISAFMDESGKFSDSEVVVIGFVVALNWNQSQDFTKEWAHWLNHNGLQFLEMKEALKIYRPLSSKVRAQEPSERIAALLPFINCIRRHLQMIGGVAIDVREYKTIPEAYRRIWSDNPCYTAFARSVLEILRDSPQDGIISFYCDDEEQTALPFYQLYRKIKIQYEDARGCMKGITFTDDKLSFVMQAADLAASVIRQEALLRFRNEAYEFKPLFDAVEKNPEPGEQIIKSGVAWCDRDQLTRLGESYKVAKLDKPNVTLTDLSK